VRDLVEHAAELVAETRRVACHRRQEAAHVAEVYLPRRVVANAAAVQAARIAQQVEVALAGPLELGEEGVVPRLIGSTPRRPGAPERLK
jgi:hypothetical protein